MERQNGILWRIARLHPGWITLVVWLGYGAALGFDFARRQDQSVLASLWISAFMLFFMGYPLFALLFVRGRFRSRSARRAALPLAAFGGLQAFSLFLSFVNLDWYEAQLESGSAFAMAFHLVLLIAGFSAFFYLFVGAAVALASAEKGPTARLWRKIGTALQFFYLPLCVYFLHRRIRRLILEFESGDPIIFDLPLESLKIERQAGGRLYLLLTERIGWEDFERYAEELLDRLDGRVAERGCSADMHLWNVEIETLPLRLVYDDFPNGVTLESDSPAGDMLLKKLQRRLAPAAAGG